MFLVSRRFARSGHVLTRSNHILEARFLSRCVPPTNSERLLMSSEGKRRKLEGGSAGSPVASLVDLDRYDSEILASHKQAESIKAPGGLLCTDHSFRTALDYSGEVKSAINGCRMHAWQRWDAWALLIICPVLIDPCDVRIQKSFLRTPEKLTYLSERWSQTARRDRTCHACCF